MSLLLSSYARPVSARRPITASMTAATGIGRACRSALSALSRRWSAWHAARALAALDDAGLHDIGIGRSEIEAAVRHGRGRLR